MLPLGPYACWATRNADNPFVIIQPGVETSANMSLTTAWRRCITYKMQIPIQALAPAAHVVGARIGVSLGVQGLSVTSSARPRWRRSPKAGGGSSSKIGRSAFGGKAENIYSF